MMREIPTINEAKIPMLETEKRPIQNYFQRALDEQNGNPTIAMMAEDGGVILVTCQLWRKVDG